MKNDWKTDEFKATTIKENMDSGVFNVPKYQRGIVWSDKQRAELVDTIKKGLPFGSLLLYKKADETYQIIDGLQRCTSLIKFVDNPTMFFDEDDIDDNVIHEIYKLIGVRGNQSAIEDNIKEELKKWVKEEHTTMDAVKAMQFSKFGRRLTAMFPTLAGKEFDIGDMIEPMMEEYKSICIKISDTRVPAIVVSGDSEQLPVLFERINSKGTTLSKYQIYAATWIDEKFKITDDDLLKIVQTNRDRYDLMLDNTGALDNYDSQEFVNNRELNAFEVAFGFGKMICGRWPHLFSKSENAKAVESVGFNLINICLGKKNADAKTMNTDLRSKVGDNICVFLKCILNSISIVDKLIGKYSKFKSNSRTEVGRPLHTEFQIISIIASVFLLKYATIEYDDDYNVCNIKYDFNHTNLKWKTEQEEQFKKNVAKIYTIDVLQHKWAGAGDRKLDQFLLNPDYYCREVGKKEIEGVIDSWYAQLNSERMEIGKVASPKEPELLLIAIMYLTIFKADQQLDESKYDIEHLGTKKLMRKQLDRFNGELRLPISSIGNLCLLPEYENRSKGEKTIYQDKDYIKKSKYSLDELERIFTLTKQEDMQWMNDFTLSIDEVKTNYYNFINKRYNKIKDILLSNF